jgi:hypothetical protein
MVHQELGMPELSKVLTTEDLQRRGGVTSLDLSPYVAIIAGVREQGGVGGVLTLGEEESQRTEKRRMSMAAKQLGVQLTWRSSSPGQLRFVVNEHGQPVPGSRTRRTAADRQVEQTVIDAVMTPEVAEVTDTTALPADDGAVSTSRGGRRRRTS